MGDLRGLADSSPNGTLRIAIGPETGINTLSPSWGTDHGGYSPPAVAYRRESSPRGPDRRRFGIGGIASDRKPRSERRTEEQQNPDGSLQAGTGQPGSGSSVLLSARNGATAHERICDATRAAAASCGAFQPR